MGFPGGSDGKASACNAGDLDSIPVSGTPLEKDMELHYIVFIIDFVFQLCLENPL